MAHSSKKTLAIALFLGFSSGLPLLAIGSTLQAWMTEEGIVLSTVGAISIIGMPYSLKFLWAPLFDRYVPPILGRRRGWILITQLALMLLLCALSLTSPGQSLTAVLIIAGLVAFASASQDIVLDAHRRDIFPDEQLAMASSVLVVGYRLGTLMSGAAALSLADTLPWRDVYLIIAGCVLVGMVACLLAPEPPEEEKRPRSLKAAVAEPLRDFFSRKGAMEILGFILLYKLGEALAANLTVPYFLDLGYSKMDIGKIAKTVGLAALLIGGVVGGNIASRIGINKSLWIFGFLQAVSVICFAWLYVLPVDPINLGWVVSLEYFAAGMGTSAYVAYMGAQCNRRFSATQYALLTSLMGVPRTILSSPTGAIAEVTGWPGFFCLCAALAVPGMVMLLRVAPWNEKRLVTS